MKNHKKELTGVVKAQATTTKRTGITVKQQYRWHTTFDSAMATLRRNNTGVCPVTGKTFGELSPHFLIGGDEECLLASDGNVSVIGDKQKKKHEKRSADSRVSITLYRTGTAGGTTGPTAFLPAGVKRAMGFTDAFLEDHGAAKGSTIVMTETGFMTEKAWIAVTKKQIEGIRALPYVKNNPEWWALKVVDGFGAHVSSPEAMQMYWDAKIILLKEEADSSHVNQAFDKFVAKEDKINMRDLLSLLRRTTSVTKGVVDQWGLVHVGLAAVRMCVPRIWISSFKAVNLHPHFRVPFAVWCKRIESFLEGGQTFKAEEPLDLYAMLPPIWQGMEPEEKVKVFEIIEEHKGFSVDCLRQLHSDCHILMSDMQHIRVSYEVAKMHPVHLTLCAPAEDGEREVDATEAAAAAEVKSVNRGLSFFQLKPEGLKGEALFDHMAGYARTHAGSCEITPSAYLDVEMSTDQKRILNPSAQDLTMRELMKDAGGDGASLKLGKRKLDNLGVTIKSYSCIANDPERVKRLRSALELAASVAEISRVSKDSKAAKKTQATNALHDAAPEALMKLQAKGNDIGKITKKDIVAIALRYFGSALNETPAKSLLIVSLKALIAARPQVLDNAMVNANPAPATGAAAAAADVGL
jgi:hypothetical protein